jgi:hypothetical protein
MEHAACVGGDRRLKTRFENVVVFMRISRRGGWNKYPRLVSEYRKIPMSVSVQEEQFR